MDCCGMPMAVRPGGGLMCRRCGAAVAVPVEMPVNPCARAVTEAPERMPVVPAVVPAPLEVPPPPGFEAEPEMTAEEAAEAVGGFQGPEMFADVPPDSMTFKSGAVLEALPEDGDPLVGSPVSFPVEQPKVSGFGRRGRRGGAK